MEITVIKQDYAISFAFRPHLLEAVKTLPDRKWNENRKVWTVPLIYKDDVNKFMLRWGFKFVAPKEPAKEIAMEDIQIKEVPTGDNLDLSFMKMQPYPY